MYYLISDGGSKGNPGPSACAWGVRNDDDWLFIDSMYLDNGTNNAAEYRGMLYGLLTIKHSNINELTLLSDSELMIKQLKGEYTVKSETLKPLHNQVKQILNSLTIPITITHNTRDDPWITDIDKAYNLCMKVNTLKI